MNHQNVQKKFLVHRHFKDLFGYRRSQAKDVQLIEVLVKFIRRYFTSLRSAFFMHWIINATTGIVLQYQYSTLKRQFKTFDALKNNTSIFPIN